METVIKWKPKETLKPETLENLLSSDIIFPRIIFQIMPETNIARLHGIDPVSYPYGSARAIQLPRQPIAYTLSDIQKDPDLLHGQGDSYLIHRGNYYLVPTDKKGKYQVGIKIWQQNGATILSPALYTITSRPYRGSTEISEIKSFLKFGRYRRSRVIGAYPGN